MCPLVLELKERKQFATVVCVTGQHKEMLSQVLDAFGVEPDYDLEVMKDGQSLFDVTDRILLRISRILCFLPALSLVPWATVSWIPLCL